MKNKKKLVTGIIIGGAIGSIIGVTMAPKTGKETRKIIQQKSSGAFGSFVRGMKALVGGKKKKKI